MDETESTKTFPCACKGVRTCIICESEGKVTSVTDEDDVVIYHYCYHCQKAWTSDSPHPDHHGDSLDFSGIYIKEQFILPQEEQLIVDEIYKTPFVDSQSGRRKQDFGPKVNFKRKKLKTQCFTGLPHFSKDLYQRMLAERILSDFAPVEQCHLEYSPDRGSAIDPHFDDFWLWGDRLVTVNLMSDTILNFTCDNYPKVCVNVPLLQRSLIVVYGEARTVWKHGIRRTDVKETRIAVTLRELSQEFGKDGEREAEGKALIETALTFNGKAVGTV